MMHRLFQVLISVFFIFVSSCRDKDNQAGNSRNRPDDKINKKDNIQLVFERFEKDLFQVTKESFKEDTARLRKKYGNFLEIYAKNITRLGGIKSPMFKESLLGFINNPDIRSLYNAVSDEFKNPVLLQEGLDAAFTRYKILFPDSTVPRIYTMVAGFSYSVVTTDSALAIGLDLYLGKDSRFYELLAIPAYKVEKMRKELMLADAVRGYLMTYFPNDFMQKDLVSQMLYHGKILYLTSQMLPDETEANLLGYDDAQLAWCEENEARIWSHFIDKKLFYSTDFNHEIAYINDGPFTKGFPDKAPARIGVWLGYQIIKKYMEKNQTTIPELFKIKEAHKIFSNSSYKPGRV